MSFLPTLPQWIPRPYQERAVTLGISQACLGLLLDPGLGKTTIVYAIFKILKDLGFAKRILVVAPKKVMQHVWPKQKNEWSQFQDLTVTVLHGSRKEQLLRENSDIHVINPEGLPWLTGAEFISNSPTTPKNRRSVVVDQDRMKFIRENYDILVVDESTKFKDSQSNRFKIMKKLVPMFKRRYILTGTVVPNGLINLFGQIYILDEGAALGQFITHYRQKYFLEDPHVQGMFTPQEGAEEKIASRIAEYTLRLKREDHLKMPKLIFQDIWVDLPPDAMVEYKRMEKELIAKVEAGTIVAANAAVASAKCRQIANGAVYLGDGGYQVYHHEKLDALEDLIEEMSGQPLLISYQWVFDREAIQDKIDIPCIGQGSEKKDGLLIDRFNSGALACLLGHPETISLGLNLQGSCSHLCWFGVPWNLEHYLQTIDRIYRQGQRAESVIVHRILARGTLDERMLAVLDAKEGKQNSFMDMLQSLRERK